MRYRTRTAIAVAAVGATALGAGTAHAAPANITFRVEGPTSTLYEGKVTTDGHDVTTPTGGTHKCDGTNNGFSPVPVPVGTAALDDAAKLSGFGFDGTWFPSFEDFVIDEIAGIRPVFPEFWGLYVNQKASTAGGCQMALGTGDEALWSVVQSGPAPDFLPQSALRLTGPTEARVGQPITVRVVEGEQGAPQAGATVAGATTGPDGTATFSFAEKGIYRVKAEKAGAVRSAALTICVDPAGVEPCVSADAAAPTVAFRMPGSLASELGRSRTFAIWWQADDGQGSGASRYAVDVREVASGAAGAQDEWRTLHASTPLTAVHYRGDSGATYEFRVTAIDRALNRSQHALARVSVPIDDRDRRLLTVSKRGWRQVRRPQAWGRTVIRSRRDGATVKVRFAGRQVALLGRRLAGGGRMRVSVDGRSKVVRVRGRSADRTVLFRSAELRPGTHTLRVRALGKVEIDAVAPTP
jgi:hypothetical protein